MLKPSRALLCLFFLISTTSFAEAQFDRFSAGGYFRLMARPDFQGGNGNLGYSNLYGRLMNEGPYALLEMKLDVLPHTDSETPWATILARIEGGSIAGADPQRGSLVNFRLSRFLVSAGNITGPNIIYEIGTLWYWYGELGVFDARPAQMFEDTLGFSAKFVSKYVDVWAGVGDSGFYLRGLSYAPILTAGAGARIRAGQHFEFGAGSQVSYEPFVPGNKNSSYATPGLTYENFVRKEVVQQYDLANPGRLQDFPNPLASRNTNLSYRVVGYLGFGKVKILKWNNLFVSWKRLHPDQTTTENYQGKEYTLYIADLTRDRYQWTVGDEMQLELIPQRLDAVAAVMIGQDINLANKIKPGEDNRFYVSGVLRLQLSLTRQVHWLLENSLAQETSTLGNLYRSRYDSIFQSTNGQADGRGLQYGDSAIRRTWQFKTGVVLNPTGFGIYARPSIRILYGFQYSSQQAAFGNAFNSSLDQFNAFPSRQMSWHHLISLETEGWF